VAELGRVDRRELRDSLLDGQNSIHMHYADMTALTAGASDSARR
jgi:hypothetical protein